MEKIFEIFADLLCSRIENKVYTTEDSVRYLFFAAMLENNIKPNNIVLEFPHPKIERAQIDTWLPVFNGNPVAIEFKYDRPVQTQSKATMNKTDRSGAVFEDLRRLQLACHDSPTECYFIYATSIEMHKYFNNKNNRHVEFYNLCPGYSFEITSEYFNNRPKSFSKRIKGEFETKVVNVLKRNLPKEHYLRIFRVYDL